MNEDRLYAAAAAYIGMGWHVFTVRDNKLPFANCGRCPAGAHTGSACVCLRCHGHLAATRDLSRVAAMIFLSRGKCALAVSCGPSGLVVVDAEADDRIGYGMTGVEYLEQHLGALPQTLRARSSGGGYHLYYRDPAGGGGGGITSMNRALPNIDIKARGGYVVVPPAEGRRWENWGSGIAALPAGVLPVRAAGGHGSGGGGVSRVIAAVEAAGGVVGDGMRYEYTRDMVYKLRKQGVSWDEAVTTMRAAYSLYAQPPAARYEMPWSRVEYELVRAWQRVEVDVLDVVYEHWMKEVLG